MPEKTRKQEKYLYAKGICGSKKKKKNKKSKKGKK